MATRDNIYKNMATQRTKANLYKTGYRRTKEALQKQQKINAAMSSTLAAQSQTVTTSPKVVQPKTVKTQATQNSNTTAQVVQGPTTPGTHGAGNVPATTVTTLATATTAVAPVAVGRGGGNPQMVQVKQEPTPPGNVATPKTTSTIIRRGKGRGQKISTVSVVDALPEGNEYLVEVGEEDLEGSDSDPAELYEILAEINGPEEEIEEGLEPEVQPPI